MSLAKYEEICFNQLEKLGFMGAVSAGYFGCAQLSIYCGRKPTKTSHTEGEHAVCLARNQTKDLLNVRQEGPDHKNDHLHLWVTWVQYDVQRIVFLRIINKAHGGYRRQRG